MSEQSSIQWTDATWNPSTGCTKISPGCANCYIERTPPFRMNGRKFVGGKIPLLLHEERLDAPLSWKKPKRVFVNSLSDLFHEDVPLDFVAKVLGVIAYCRRHTFQVLTKRANRMLDAVSRLTLDKCLNAAGLSPDFLPTWPPENMWLGVSVENKKHGLPRINQLASTPAAIRFLSIEPLLEDLGDITSYLAEKKIGWVIAGGESGPNSRGCRIEWLRSIVAQCRAGGIPCFLKQLGSLPVLGYYDEEREWALEHKRSVYCPIHGEHRDRDMWQPSSGATIGVKLKDGHGGDPAEWPESLQGARAFPEVTVAA